MDKEKLRLATTVDLELFDGSTVPCTLAMYRLKLLASKDKALYNTAMKVLSKGTEDIIEQMRVVYAAYVCANMDSEDLLTEDEFIMACGSDYVGIGETLQKLMNPKKRKASDNLSN